MKMTTKQATIELKKVSADIKATDNEIIKTAEKLKIVLLNLKIEEARIKQHTSISPIVVELGRSIERIENSVKKLIEEDRVRLKEVIETFEKLEEK